MLVAPDSDNLTNNGPILLEMLLSIALGQSFGKLVMILWLKIQPTILPSTRAIWFQNQTLQIRVGNGDGS